MDEINPRKYNLLMANNSYNPFSDDFLLDPAITFLNHGSFGAVPKPVFREYQNWQLEMERQPVEFLGRRASGLLQESRVVLANYLGTSANNLVYVTNATFGLNIIARSLKLTARDEVLTSNHEYGALDRTWRFLSQKHGFKYINFPLSLPVTNHHDFVEEFWGAVNDRTKVIFISHITSPTAMIFPVEEICRRAKAAGILTVIDGAHAPGQIPVNLDEMQADFYSGNLHKWLCAPKGAAFLYAHPRVQSLVEPLIVSWGWESENPGPSKFIDTLEWQGTRDLSAFLSVPAAIKYQNDNNWPSERIRCHQLAVFTQQQIAELTSISPLHISPDPWCMQMAASPLPESTDIDLLKHRLYDEYQIELPVLQWERVKLIRYSFQAYNTLADSQKLLDALSRLLPECKL